MKSAEYIAKLQMSLEALEKIDHLLKTLEKNDPYGDLIENFAEFPDKYPPVTKRLIKMVKEDLKIAQRNND